MLLLSGRISGTTPANGGFSGSRRRWRCQLAARRMEELGGGGIGRIGSKRISRRRWRWWVAAIRRRRRRWRLVARKGKGRLGELGGGQVELKPATELKSIAILRRISISSQKPSQNDDGFQLFRRRNRRHSATKLKSVIITSLNGFYFKKKKSSKIRRRFTTDVCLIKIPSLYPFFLVKQCTSLNRRYLSSHRH